MAAGDIKWFQQGLVDLGNKIHNLSADALMLGIVTNITVPTMATAGPNWGGVGATNFAPNQVGVGGGYVGPIALASVSWTNVAGVVTLRATDVLVPQSASGFANGAFGVIFNSTDANKRALGYIEISAAGSTSIVSGSFTFDFQGASGMDILRLTPS